MEKKTRNRTAHHNLSLTVGNYNPNSIKSIKVTILYTSKDTKVRRYSPIEIPMNAFNKDKGELKRGFEKKFPIQNKWIQKFISYKNDLEVKMQNGEIDYEHAFRVLKNDYESGIINDLYPKHAYEKRISKSVQNTILERLVTIQNHFLKLGYKNYGVLNYAHLQRISDRNKIETIILKEIDSISSSTKKKYFNYLNQIANVNPNFTKTERTPFVIALTHSSSPPKLAMEHKAVKRGILKIGDNLYNLESYLWWLLSFCLRGVDTCDIVCMNEGMIESSLGGKGGVFREYYPWLSNFDAKGSDYSNNEKFYLVGKRAKESHKGKDNRSEVKILYNQTPVLLIHKMLKRVISIIHPDLVYKGKDKLKLYNIDYKSEKERKTWHHRRGAMSNATKRLFEGTLKQTRHTFSTILADVLSVNYNQADKQLSTSLGHANDKSQRFYVNPNQDKMDILQIEVIERFGVREIVENLIKVCSTVKIKNPNGEEEPMLDIKLLKESPLTVSASWWDWNKELRFQQLRKQSDSKIQFTQDKDGNWIEKEVEKHNSELSKMIAERHIAFIKQRESDIKEITP